MFHPTLFDFAFEKFTAVRYRLNYEWVVRLENAYDPVTMRPANTLQESLTRLEAFLPPPPSLVQAKCALKTSGSFHSTPLCLHNGTVWQPFDAELIDLTSGSTLHKHPHSVAHNTMGSLGLTLCNEWGKHKYLATVQAPHVPISYGTS